VKVKKYLLAFAVLLMFSSSLALVEVPVKAQEPYVKIYVYQPLGYIPPPPGPFPVYAFQIDIYIETSGIVDGSAQSIVGWALDVQVDPSVIDISWGYAYGAQSGYALWWWSRLNGLPYPTLLQGTLDGPNGYWKDISEQIMPTPGVPPGGAGDNHFATYPKLVTLEFDLLSDAYCKIELLRVEYMTPDGTWHAVDEVIDGDYNQPPQYTLTIAVDGFGTTAPGPGAYSYDEGTEVSVDAIPDSGYMLDHWELDTVNVGDADPYNVTMDADHNLTAFFVEITPPPIETIDDLIDLVEEFHDLGDIDDQEVKLGLLDKLYAAKHQLDKGKTKTVGNILGAFINNLKAQRGKHVSTEAADILIAGAQFIIDNL